MALSGRKTFFEAFLLADGGDELVYTPSDLEVSVVPGNWVPSALHCSVKPPFHKITLFTLSIGYFGQQKKLVVRWRRDVSSKPCLSICDAFVAFQRHSSQESVVGSPSTSSTSRHCHSHETDAFFIEALLRRSLWLLCRFDANKQLNRSAGLKVNQKSPNFHQTPTYVQISQRPYSLGKR